MSSSDALAAADDLVGHHAIALLSRAQVVAVQGKPAESADLARQAAEAFAKVGCKADAGRSHLLAGMVAADREIARHLDVTTKTVETHLAQTFAQLGVT